MRIVFLWLLCLVWAAAYPQVCITGKVVSDSSGTPVTLANVYIPEYGVASATDHDGAFTLCKLPEGTVHLQVTYVGYRTFISRVQISDTLQEINITLTPSAIDYQEVTVYGEQTSASNATANNIASLSTISMRQQGALTLVDGMAQLPGVQKLTTGPGISKPVIRGLYGNRIQTVVFGLKYDSQQWQDEHGLGLTDMGVDRIEVIKGPASLLYGSEAMGGVLNILEEKPAPVGQTLGDATVRFSSNTLGLSTDAGIKSSTENNHWRIRLGEENHADYTDGRGERVLNSRFAGYHAKASYGHLSGKWTSENNYAFSLSHMGFLLEAGQPLVPDDRNSRSFQLPHHTVFMHILATKNTFYLGRSVLKTNIGVHLNNRQEQEGGNRISLDMQLNSYTGNTIWSRRIGKNSEVSAGIQAMHQTNVNNGSRSIVPDASISEGSIFTYLKHHFKSLVMEGGFRYDLKHINTLPTGTINNDFPNNPGKEVIPFSRTYGTVNSSAGVSFVKKHWNVKANISTGYRAGNLAELSSNGLHEGTIRYEIGNIHLPIEQNACTDLTATYEVRALTVSASGFYNQFHDYIFLAPINKEYIGFPIYLYIRDNASLIGWEGDVQLHPKAFGNVSLRATCAQVTGKAGNGDYLPFIPAGKITGEVKWKSKENIKRRQTFAGFGADHILPQDHPAQFETSSPGYTLIHASAGVSFIGQRRDVMLSVAATNLLNEVYFDHLSRYKYYNIFDMGRNISVHCHITFHKKSTL
ncbi:MAG: TonB-dependent receptor [Flavobacteriales bacterium]|nr:TonB-dependent receptor [Flavobacteriales bacterium]